MPLKCLPKHAQLRLWSGLITNADSVKFYGATADFFVFVETDFSPYTPETFYYCPRF